MREDEDNDDNDDNDDTLVALALREFFASDAPLTQAEDAAAFRAQTLRDDDDDDGSGPAAASVLSSLPPASYVAQLAAVLSLWRRSGRCPVQLLPAAVGGVAETRSSLESLLCVSPEAVAAFIVDGLRSAEDTNTRVALCAAFIERLGGARGILTLLGFRETVGSRNVCPLTRAQCVAAFSERHREVALTVGARAFSKHCERSADGWWGPLRGNDEAKNRVARQKLDEILDGGAWKNVHSLPHAQVTMEVRNALGFGARWTVDDGAFRGFLEPQMADGHATRWRH